MGLAPIVTHALASGVILSVILFAMILVLVKVNPEIMLRDYPPDIQAKFGPMSDRSRRLRIPIGILVIAVLLGAVGVSLAPVLAGLDGQPMFLTVFVHLLVMFTVFNVLDLLIMDWLIVVTLRPRFLVLPGTEGMPGYGDYAFHFRGFLIGTPITLVASILLAGLVSVLF